MIQIAPLRLSEHDRWAELWSEYQRFYGVELPAAVAESARAAGANSPYWLTHQSNAVARQLYDRLGQNQGFVHYVYTKPVDTDRVG